MSPKDKVLDKLSKLKAHMESAAQVSTEEEAQAFSAAIQRLLMEHKLTMEDIPDPTATVKEEPINKYRVDLYEHDIAVKKRRVAWQERIGSIVSRAYYCSMLVSHSSNHIWFVGTESDTKIAEFMYVKLVRLLVAMSEKEYVKAFYECKGRGHVEEARGFKESFLAGFCNRLQERLTAERRKVEEEATASCTSLVPLRNAETRVAQFMAQFSKASHGPSMSNRNSLGFQRGRESADKINFDKAIPGNLNRKEIK